MGPHTCTGLNCAKEANLCCPICAKNQNPIYFCSQECFKANWDSHKAIHDLFSLQLANSVNSPDLSQSSYNPWPRFQFTGPLRPFPTTTQRIVPQSIPKPDYRPKILESAYSEGVKILSSQEQAGVRAAAAVGRAVLNHAASFVRAGVTTEEIDRQVHEKCIELGAYPSPLTYRGFPKACCTSVNEVICHGIPDKRPLVDGDICNVDISVFFKGFHADLNETFLVGGEQAVDSKGKQLVDCARACLEAAIAIIKPGVAYRKIGEVIEGVANARGFSVVRAYCGHGIHRFFHAPPNIPHYARNKAVGFIKAGHCFTIEPMINEGTWKDTIWPDDWTAVTLDGKRSAQFEHMLLVTEKGCEVLTR